MSKKGWNSLLTGAIDLHTHSSPSIFPRSQTDWELIADVDQAKMGGVVLKAHEGVTYGRAALLQEKYPDLLIKGGLVCNLFTGGMNVHAVDMALRMGAAIIWMPTLSAAQHQEYFSKNSKPNILNSGSAIDRASDGLTVTTNGIVKDEVKSVLSVIAEYDAVLATGHLGADEVLLLVDEAKSQGVKRILIQHADLGISPYTIDQQKHLAQEGCIIEKCYLAVSNDFKDLTIADMAASIKDIGPEHCALVTDYGQAHHPPVVEALESFLLKLNEAGITADEIRTMAVEKPRALLEV